MKTSRLLNRILPFMGTVMILAWILIVGPLGGLLIGAVAYFMSVENAFAGAVCATILFSPVVLTIIWGCGAGAEAILEKRFDRAALFLNDASSVPLSLPQNAK